MKMLLSLAERRGLGQCETCGETEGVETYVRIYVASEPTWHQRMLYRTDPNDSTTGGKRTEEHRFCLECIRDQERETWLSMRGYGDRGGYGI